MRNLRALLVSLLVALIASLALAQPQAPLKIIVGFAPGGSLDTVARLAGTAMGQELGRPVVIENRPGADGNIAAELVSRGPADGSVMLATFNTHPFLASLHPRLGFDPIEDFKPVGLIASTPYLLVANPNLPGQDLREALAKAKSEGRVQSFGTVGPGSPQHLSGVRLQTASGVPITIVHYKGGSPALNDVMAGHVDMMISTIALGMPQVRAGKLKVLGVSTAQRLPGLPSVPTLDEAGFSGIMPDGWFGFLLPARAPTAVATGYNEALNRALQTPAVRERLEALGAPPLGGSLARMDKQMREERDIWSKIVKDNGVRVEE